MARCRKLVSPPLSPPARPWPSAGRDAGRPADFGCPPCTPACWRPYPSAPPWGLPAACSSLALPLCFVVLVSCYGSVQEVSEPSLESPRPPEWWQRRGAGRPVVPPWPPCTPALPPLTRPPPWGLPCCLLFPCSSIVRCLLSACFPSFS